MDLAPLYRPARMTKRRLLRLALLLAGVASPLGAASVYTTRPDDPGAVYLTAQEFGVRGDGTTDDSAAIQAAIDKAAGKGVGGGIVFVPAGRYRLTRTIYVWRGVRVIGYGPTRPVFVLRGQHAGLPEGHRADGDVHARARSAGRRRRGQAAACPSRRRARVPPSDDMPDATPSTFYSAMSNVDFEIGDGNPAAVAIRFHVAQHGVPQPHGLPYRLRSGGAHRDRQRGRGSALLRRPLRHPHRQHVAVLAVHADRFRLRRPARGRDSRARWRS